MRQSPRIQSRQWATKQRSGVIIVRLFIAAIFVGCLAGCAATGLPTVEERSAVGASDRAIVLLRVQCTIESQQPYEAFSHSLTDDNISFGLGSFETGGEPERLALLRFLSSESRKNGWTFLVLPHGIHYLAVYPPRRTNVFTYERGIRNAPRWRIDIPQDAKLVYVGTLRVTGESDRLLFGGRILRSIRFDEMSVGKDEASAQKLVTEELPGFGEAQTALMSLHKGPIILRSPLPQEAR